MTTATAKSLNIKTLCKPRASVFEASHREDVLDLDDLKSKKINGEQFFEENYFTNGMHRLINAAFERFAGKSSNGLIKLTQSMGGGKTHNMIALGLLAQNPYLRQKIKIKDQVEDEVTVLAFTGRESSYSLGIWGAIAEQMGKKELFKEFYEPLQAPGQSAWINLLKGQKVLILLDELPPYLENAKSRSIGDSNLSQVTQTALSNLFNALNKEELANVCVVISDLKATYESGSELIQSTFKDFESEIGRSALNIEPVASTSDDIYHILKTRLFEELPDSGTIKQVAQLIKDSVSKTQQMQLTSYSPEKVYDGILVSYPFHPSLRPLYERFKENQGFQQTRGLIRLMRKIVADIHKNESDEQHLINVFDINLNNSDIRADIQNINPNLKNAISSDVANEGRSFAEEADIKRGNPYTSEVARLILISSLANIQQGIVGLSKGEILGYISSPLVDISLANECLDDYVGKAWYLHNDRDGRIAFKNSTNLIAELNSLKSQYTNDHSRKELKTYLHELFKPSLKDCYQEILIFPAISEIDVSKEKVSLIISEPHETNKLNPELEKFFHGQQYKNRMLFLSGSRKSMESLIETTKEYKAINHILSKLKEEKFPESDPQYKRAEDKMDKINLSLLSAINETFITVYYPHSSTMDEDKLLSADIRMNFNSSQKDGESEIRRLLEEKNKFNPISREEFDSLRKKVEAKLFTRPEMRWDDIKDRAARHSNWGWYHPSTLEDLRGDLMSKDLWRETTPGYISKGPFDKDPTDVNISVVEYDEKEQIVILKITPVRGSKVLYEIGQEPSDASSEIENLNRFRTAESKLFFKCVDSTGEHKPGPVKTWQADIKIKHRIYNNKSGARCVELISIPKADIKYTTDGQNPRDHGGVYESPFELPEDSTLVLAVAEKSGVSSNIEEIKVSANAKVEIDDNKALKFQPRQKSISTSETFETLKLLKELDCKVKDLSVNITETDNGSPQYIELNFGPDLTVDLLKLEEQIQDIRNVYFPQSSNVTMNFKLEFNSGRDFKEWMNRKKLSDENIDANDIKQG